ncbi:Cystathionine beta-lyase/cystathionine gamma-synthase-like protein [Thermoanaerobacter sp. X514]|nr:Cystathionine beta-lyase/cystathionine gamma-synthase-like protein [Thermoanaerobacter sp. X514]
MCQLAVSLGDTETLVEVPSLMTHRGYPKEKLVEFGLSESMVRISVGLEDYNDIIEDLDQALNQI